MTKLILSAALLAITAPALANTPIDFERDGSHFVGTLHEKKGVQYISGIEIGSGARFSLRVDKGLVSGDYDGAPVAYHVPAGAPLATLASR